MPRIFKNENLMAENSRILKWFIWRQKFDFEVVYKHGYLNYVSNMLSREEVSLNMFSVGVAKGKGILHEEVR